VINRRNANLFKKGLIENPKKRRDQTAQRKPFQKRLERKTPRNGVIKRRNVCGSTVSAQRFRLVCSKFSIFFNLMSVTFNY
jgi:hypothetical protein